MDRLIVEKETEKKEVTTSKTQEKPSVSIKLKVKEETKPQAQQTTLKTEYLNSLEDMTIGDVKRQEEKKAEEQFKIDKEVLIQQQFENSKDEEEIVQEQKPQAKVSQNIIEKPNYDLIEENKKIVKLKKKTKTKSVNKKKVAGIALACALGASAVVCVANTILIDNMNTQFIQIDETYKLNLAKYLQNIYKLDTAKQGMEIIETYPDDLLDAGDLGEYSNWFDKLCSFLGGLFGG